MTKLEKLKAAAEAELDAACDAVRAATADARDAACAAYEAAKRAARVAYSDAIDAAIDTRDTELDAAWGDYYAELDKIQEENSND
jgi:hypothetical protein